MRSKARKKWTKVTTRAYKGKRRRGEVDKNLRIHRTPKTPGIKASIAIIKASPDTPKTTKAPSTERSSNNTQDMIAYDTPTPGISPLNSCPLHPSLSPTPNTLMCLLPPLCPFSLPTTTLPPCISPWSFRDKDTTISQKKEPKRRSKRRRKRNDA